MNKKWFLRIEIVSIMLIALVLSMSLGNQATALASYDPATGGEINDNNNNNSNDNSNNDNRDNPGYIPGIEGNGQTGVVAPTNASGSMTTTSATGVGTATTVVNPQATAVISSNNNNRTHVNYSSTTSNHSNSAGDMANDQTSSPTENTNIVGTASQNSVSQPIKNSLTASKYRNYLANYSKKDAIQSGIPSKKAKNAVQQAKRTLSRFNNMTTDEQQNYINTINNPVKELNNSRFIVTNIRNFTHKSKTHKTVIRSASATGYLSPGKYIPAAAQFHIHVTFSSKGKKIKHILGSEAYVDHAYNPTVSLPKEGQTTYKFKNKIHSNAKWAYILGIGKFGVQLGTIHLKIQVNYKGSVTDFRFYHTT